MKTKKSTFGERNRGKKVKVLKFRSSLRYFSLNYRLLLNFDELKTKIRVLPLLRKSPWHAHRQPVYCNE
jgi:hypothetical protein